MHHAVAVDRHAANADIRLVGIVRDKFRPDLRYFEYRLD